MLFRRCCALLIITACLEAAQGAPNDELSYSPMQMIQSASGAAPSLANASQVVTKQVIQRQSVVRSASVPALSVLPSVQTVTTEITRGTPALGAASSAQTLAHSAGLPGLNSVHTVTTEITRRAPASGTAATLATSAQSFPQTLARSAGIPGLNSAQTVTTEITRAGAAGAAGVGAAATPGQNLPQALVSGGLRVLGQGVQTQANLATMPARIAVSGIEEVRKVADAALATNNTSGGGGDIRARIVSGLMNTISSQISQGNIGGAVVEEALKNRVKDMVHRIADVAAPPSSAVVQVASAAASGGTQVPPITTKVVNNLLTEFNRAVRRNDERLMQALKMVIGRVEPPRNTAQTRTY